MQTTTSGSEQVLLPSQIILGKIFPYIICDHALTLNIFCLCQVFKNKYLVFNWHQLHLFKIPFHFSHTLLPITGIQGKCKAKLQFSALITHKMWFDLPVG